MLEGTSKKYGLPITLGSYYHCYCYDAGDMIWIQVSRLVIIHEEGEAGHQMPDLERPVQAVSKVCRVCMIFEKIAGKQNKTVRNQGII